MVAAIWSPTMIDLADEPSCVRAIVNVSVEIIVTLTISAFVEFDCTPVGHTVALNGGVGNLVPCPAATTSVVPEVAGDGAVATEDKAKFL